MIKRFISQINAWANCSVPATIAKKQFGRDDSGLEEIILVWKRRESTSTDARTAVPSDLDSQGLLSGTCSLLA